MPGHGTATRESFTLLKSGAVERERLYDIITIPTIALCFDEPELLQRVTQFGELWMILG